MSFRWKARSVEIGWPFLLETRSRILDDDDHDGDGRKKKKDKDRTAGRPR